jgi:hypothetical protein
MHRHLYNCSINSEDSFIIRDDGDAIGLEVLSKTDEAYVGVSISIHQAKSLRNWLNDWINEKSEEKKK